MRETEADLVAALALVGCETVPRCPWQGVVEIQYKNAQGRKWRSCRSHAAAFREMDDHRVTDKGWPNRLLVHA